MPPLHGPRVIGQEAYDAQVKAEQEHEALHGGAAAMYGPRVLGKKAVQLEAETPADGEQSAGDELTIAQLAEALAREPHTTLDRYLAEAEREGGPRKGALKVLRASEAQKPAPDAELLAALDAAIDS